MRQDVELDMIKLRATIRTPQEESPPPSAIVVDDPHRDSEDDADPTA